jgi:hypothetical protein
MIIILYLLLSLFLIIGLGIYLQTKPDLLKKAQHFFYHNFFLCLLTDFTFKALFSSTKIDKRLLLLPIVKKNIIFYNLLINLKPSLLGFLNGILILFVGLFLLEGSFFEKLLTLTTLSCYSLSSSTLSIPAKFHLSNYKFITSIIGVVLVALFFSNYLQIISVYLFQKNIFSGFFLAGICLGVAYLVSSFSLKKIFYSEKSIHFSSFFTASESYFSLKLKLITRNKIPRFVAIQGLLLIPYFAFFSKSLPNYFAEVFFSATTLLLFGQTSVFSWESSFFEGKMTYPLLQKDVLRQEAKFYSISILISMSVSLIFSFLSPNPFLSAFVTVGSGIFHLGCTLNMVLLINQYNYEPINLRGDILLNYQGLKANIVIGIFLFMSFPCTLIYFFPFYGTCLLIGLGTIGILLRAIIIEKLTEVFKKQKYKMIEGFRGK